jgi:hypothetical protein
LRKVDVDECVNGYQEAYFLDLPLELEEDVVLLEYEVVDVFEMREIEPEFNGEYFLTKDFMYFIVIYFSCFPYSLHS